ncbi:MAG: hypothetical protein [Bacteriophage sp.]|nr:MAG: hypothetical protein [Bacteriophage sp.]
MTIPVSASGDTSIGQAFKGSPLRIADTWRSGTKYYDGKREAENGIFYQDVVLYKDIYYVCVNTDSGEDDHWETSPITATYWSAFSLSPDIMANAIIANKAFIKELSTEEVVVFDENNNIAAGMTSSRAIKSSALPQDTNKGDVRIWAGEFTGGDLTTAPFTVTSAGKLNATDADITGTVNSKSGNIGGFTISDKSLVSESGSIIKFFNR